MSSHLDSHTPTDVKRDILSGVQTGNRIPHDRYNIRGRGIAHAHCAHKQKIQHFHAKTTRVILYIYNTRRWTYSPLQYCLFGLPTKKKKYLTPNRNLSLSIFLWLIPPTQKNNNMSCIQRLRYPAFAAFFFASL